MRLTSLCILFTSGGVVMADSGTGAQIDARLRTFIQGNASQTAEVIVLMEPVRKGLAPPPKYRRAAVINYLDRVSQESANALRNQIGHARGLTASAVRLQSRFWINNSVTARVTPAGLRSLAAVPGVRKIYLNGTVTRDPVPNPSIWPSARGLEEIPYSFKEIGLDRLISESPSVNGKGVFVGHIDTGVDGSHPALKGRVVTYFDATTNKKVPPTDTGNHGTHTAGTILGGDRKDTFIGVAPGARLVASGPLGSYSGLLRSMEFMLAPFGEQTRQSEVPITVSNSWNCRGAPDMELFYKAISAWEAAGILPVFSAGNSGPSPMTITPPHEHPSVIAVGATNEKGVVTDFSSRGPGIFRGEKTLKPDLTAPGNNVLSTLPRGRYGEMSGTSMAAPHVAGAVALLSQVNPSLNPAQIREILVKTAVPTMKSGKLGRAGHWNAAYGYGKMDVYAAVKAAKTFARGLRRGLMASFLSPTGSESAFTGQGESMAGMRAGDTAWADEWAAPMHAPDAPMQESGSSWMTLSEVL